jgi:membrane protein DedA with SNARE-associated domain
MEPNEEKDENRYAFLLKNLLRGLVILGLFILAFILFEKFEGVQYFQWLEPVYSNPFLVFLIYVISEVFFGIFPPELFMAWGLKQGGALTYVLIVFLLALISYGAGWLNYLIGLSLRKVKYVRWLIRKYMKRYAYLLNRFGGFLIIVASVTPLPYAGICLLVGTVNYSRRKFMIFTLFRLLRFAVYAYIVWLAGGWNG